MIADGDHEDCAVCGLKLEYYCIDAGYHGDTDVATCEECGAGYAEGWIQPIDPWTDANVPKMQIAYLKQAVRTAECEKFIKDQFMHSLVTFGEQSIESDGVFTREEEK